MTRVQITLRGFVLVALALIVAACDKKPADTDDSMLVTTSELAIDGIKATDTDNALSAVVGASEIPYPVYPNGTKYRVGGENGLKIVVFQTEDPFHKVDSFYNGLSDNEGMSRLMAMSDYVRYSRGTQDIDPWATHLPGIVIHEFDDEDSRQSVGASAIAKTNIIMSF